MAEVLNLLRLQRNTKKYYIQNGPRAVVNGVDAVEHNYLAIYEHPHRFPDQVVTQQAANRQNFSLRAVENFPPLLQVEMLPRNQAI